MSALTDAQERLALYKEAERVILTTGQSYQIGTQRFDRGNLYHVQAEIRRLEQQVSLLSVEGQGQRLSHSQAICGGRR